MRIRDLHDGGAGAYRVMGALNADGIPNPRTGDEWRLGTMQSVVRTLDRDLPSASRPRPGNRVALDKHDGHSGSSYVVRYLRSHGRFDMSTDGLPFPSRIEHLHRNRRSEKARTGE